MALASDGPYASLHLALERDTCASTPPLIFLQARCSSCRPTNSIIVIAVLCACGLSYDNGVNHCVAITITGGIVY